MKRGFVLIAACGLLFARASSAQEMTVEGTLGTLPASAVRSTIQARHPEMTTCFTSRYPALQSHGGRIAFLLRVAVDGSVRDTRILDSTVGDRETERCVARVGRSLRFPRPVGGEAEVRETFEVPPRQGIRPPTTWAEARVRPAIARQLEGLRRRCGLGTAQVKLIVIIGPGGRALMAGASSEADLADTAYDCVSQAAMSYSYPDPGSYFAKSTFGL